mmetsp:Transcript_49960/g.87940  ORF Transcript_49960/g.87940 Transcript_49960/m.87940 type:complete len:275 (-) Transcript_49960:161-985(-)
MGDGVSKQEEAEKHVQPTIVAMPVITLSSASLGKDNTVIIFDWDDTLLCSSAINAAQWTMTQLQQLELAVESALMAAMNLGETLIVTNGNSSWVQDSSRRFLPKLVPLLEKMRVVSARALYENSWPGEPFAWKRCCFHELLSTREEERKGVEGKSDCMNLVVLGDSFAEIKAAYSATSQLQQPSIVKTLKFKESPSANELLGQLRAVTHLLPEIVREERGSCRGLEQRPLPTYLEYLTSWASGWNLVEWQSAEWQTGIRPDLLLMDSPVTLAGG